MSSVFLTTTVTSGWSTYETLLKAAQEDEVKRHTLTDSPKQADIILFAESAWGNESLKSVRSNPLVKKYREKCFVQCELDKMVPFLPGVYCSVPAKWYRHDRVRIGCYLDMYRNDFVSYVPLPQNYFLFSFVGSSETNSIRAKVLSIDDERAMLVDTAVKGAIARESNSRAKMNQFQSHYAKSISNSMFVLCPKGVSPSTVRVYEVMKAGRVPVIIANDWQPPDGPDWGSISVRVDESRIHSVPEILESMKGDAEKMGQKARLEWEKWYGPGRLFHNHVEWCLGIKKSRRYPESVLRFTAWLQMIEPLYIIDYLRRLKQR